MFRDPTKELPVGTSLCRLGFPFSRITATFDEVTNSFRIAEGVLPMPRFPNDGIHTRIVRKVDAATGREIQFVETSSPGLRGQSGGPIFDVNAHVCALQSSTVHLPLGFSPAIKQGTKEIVEHQFMHVGIGAHVQEIIQFLDRQKVAYTVAK